MNLLYWYKFTLPLHEFYFYIAILFWSCLRYYYFKQNELKIDTEFIRDFDRFDVLLTAENPYYKALSKEGKEKFIARLTAIRNEIEFQGREDFEVKEEHEILISACIAQLTFGFDKPVIPYLCRSRFNC